MIPDCIDVHDQRRPPGLESVARTRPAILKGPVSTQDGNVHQDVESLSIGHD